MTEQLLTFEEFFEDWKKDNGIGKGGQVNRTITLTFDDFFPDGRKPNFHSFWVHLSELMEGVNTTIGTYQSPTGAIIARSDVNASPVYDETHYGSTVITGVEFSFETAEIQSEYENRAAREYNAYKLAHPKRVREKLEHELLLAEKSALRIRKQIEEMDRTI